MPATTNPTATGGAAMSTTHELPAETPAEEVARIQAKFPKWSAAKVLEAVGHPGYGSAHARRVLAIVAELAAYGVTAGDVVYGSHAYQAARFAQAEAA